MRHGPTNKRTLAIDLSSRGFGYAVLDSPEHLMDWGTRRVSGNKNAQTAEKIRQLIRWYEPQVLVVEDYEAPTGIRRPARLRRLSYQVQRLGRSLNLEVIRVSWGLVRLTVGGSEKANKETIAARIAERFPELRPYLPPPRKPWMSEDERMNVFDAVGLTLGIQL